MDSQEASTSFSSKPANTRTHRSGKNYNQDPSEKYKKRTYKPSTKSVLAQVQKALESSNSIGFQSTPSTPPAQTPQSTSESSDETDDTITQTNLDTIIEDSENSDSSETTTAYTEANEGFSSVDEQRRRNITSLAIQEEETEYPPLDIPDFLFNPEPIDYSQSPSVPPYNLTIEQAEEASRIVLGTQREQTPEYEPFSFNSHNSISPTLGRGGYQESPTSTTSLFNTTAIGTIGNRPFTSPTITTSIPVSKGKKPVTYYTKLNQSNTLHTSIMSLINHLVILVQQDLILLLLP